MHSMLDDTPCTECPHTLLCILNLVYYVSSTVCGYCQSAVDAPWYMLTMAAGRELHGVPRECPLPEREADTVISTCSNCSELYDE